jgi:hypothetical protein
MEMAAGKLDYMNIAPSEQSHAVDSRCRQRWRSEAVRFMKVILSLPCGVSMSTAIIRLILSCSILCALAANSPRALAQEAGQAGPAVEKPRGKVVAGPRNIRQFDPEDVSRVVDATDINLPRVFADLGPDATLWYQHVMTLANPFFEGRAPGTRGSDLAAEYVEFYFRQYGLEPAFAINVGGDDEKPGGGATASTLTIYRQDFDFASPNPKVEMINTAAAIGENKLTSGEDYVVLGVSGNGSVTAPVTFVGYGIERGQDDYTSFEQATDLTGRIAIVMRYEPLDEEGHSRWAEARFSRYAGIRTKLTALADRKAAGIILVNPPGAVDGATGLESLQQSTRFGRRLDIPVVQMTPEAVDRLLALSKADGHDLLSLRKAADDGTIKTLNLPDELTITLSADLKFDDRLGTQNIGAILPGKGDLADQWIVIGAHYDHVGFGYTGASPANVGKLHPGADDNASGTAGLLIAAKRLVRNAETSPGLERRRSILFLAFGAEEAGLHGSDFFIEHSSVPADKIYAMINMDMIGRLRSSNLLVGGTGSAEEFDEVLKPHFEASGLTISAVPSGRGPSDHSNFFTAGVPVLFMFTGEHDDYHTPADQAYTVNPAGAIQIVDLVESIALDLASRTEPLTYVARPAGGAGRGGPAAGPTGPRVRLGITPAYNAELETGIAVEAVAEGASAADAGIQPGDVLLAWNSEELVGGQRLFALLGEAEPGEIVKMTIQRGDKNIVIDVTLKARD